MAAATPHGRSHDRRPREPRPQDRGPEPPQPRPRLDRALLPPGAGRPGRRGRGRRHPGAAVAGGRHLPVDSFPPDEVRTDLLEATDKRDHGPDKGEASYWSVTVGDRVAPNAVWSYRDPLSGRDDIKGYLAFYWHRMEAWFEEGEEVFDPAMVPFAATYADQHERDSKALQGAVASGCRSAQAGC